MYNELVKRLREIHPEEFGDKWDFAFACQQAMHEAADAIEEQQASEKKFLCNISALEMENENLKRGKRWVSVTERLPEDLQNVLVIDNGRVCIGYCEHYYGEEEVYVEWHDMLYYPIDPPFWMSLPEPPKEE